MLVDNFRMNNDVLDVPAVPEPDRFIVLLGLTGMGFVGIVWHSLRGGTRYNAGM